MGEKALIGAVSACAVLLILSLFPAGVFFSYVSNLGFLNVFLPSLAFAAIVGALMALSWGKIPVGQEAVLTLALLAFGMFFGYPAFTALGFFALVLTAYYANTRRGRARRKPSASPPSKPADRRR